MKLSYLIPKHFWKSTKNQILQAGTKKVDITKMVMEENGWEVFWKGFLLGNNSANFCECNIFPKWL